MTIDIEDTTGELLRSEAQARGLSVNEFLRILTESARPSIGAPQAGAEAARDFDHALDELFAGDSRKLPPLPLAYSREDIYFDHD